MIIARLAPADKFASFAKQGAKKAQALKSGQIQTKASFKAETTLTLVGKEKFLNARPCANCQAALVRRGVRRCFFTRGHGLVGVLEVNVFAHEVEKIPY